MKKNLCLWILALGFFLRIAGVGFGLPYFYHADEPIVVNHALAYGTGDPNPHFFKIPPLTSYVLFVFYGLSYLMGKGVGIFKSVSDFENLFFQNPTFFYLLARILLGVLVGTASLYLLCRLLRRFFSKTHALIGSFFLAICFLHVRDSHYVYTDIPLVFVLILSFFPILKITEGEGTKKNHVLAGALIGLATAVKYNGIFVAVPYLAAGLASKEKRNTLTGWGLAGLTAFLIYSLLNPFTWLDYETFRRETLMQGQASGFVGYFHPLFYSLKEGVGIFIWIFGLLGILAALFEREKKRLVLLSFVMGYYLVLVFRSQPYDRYVLPLIPFFLFFTADFLVRLSGRFPEPGRQKALVVLVLLIAAPSLAKSVVSDLLFLKKDARTLAKEWVEEEIPEGSKIALDWSFYQPRLGFSKQQLGEKLFEAPPGQFSKAQERRLQSLLSSNQKGYELYFLSRSVTDSGFLFESPKALYDLNALEADDVQYVFVTMVKGGIERTAFYEQLKQRANLVKRFSPYRDSNQIYPIDDQPLTGGPFLWKDLIARERNGQPIEIYKLNE